MSPLVTPIARRAPRDMPALPALRARVRPPSTVPMLRRPRTLAESIPPFLFWLAGVRGRRPATIRAYDRDLRCFTAFCREAGIEDPATVTPSLIEFYLAWLRESGQRQSATAARRLGASALYVEVENLEQLEEACAAGATRLLVDNQSPAIVRAWGERARSLSPGIEIEATGGITLANVREYAEAGADFVSIGALTHSVLAGDVALELRVES